MKNDFNWQGRVDSLEDDLAFRWHQCITKEPSKEGLSLLGFCCDEGVKRNKGRVGASDAPNFIRNALASLPVNRKLQKGIFDAGNIICQANNLEKAQNELANMTSKLLTQSGRLITLGGGHEIAWGSFLGAVNYLDNSNQHTKQLGIVNFDAHFDLRPIDDGASSGTPFTQAANYCKETNRQFNYCCMGVSELGNTRALFKSADSLNVNYRLDNQMSGRHINETLQQLTAFIEPLDAIYLTIDLDVFPAYMSPGVSATAAKGVQLDIIEMMIEEIINSGKLLLADIAECNPHYDIDNRTAKLAARLVYLLSK